MWKFYNKALDLYDFVIKMEEIIMANFGHGGNIKEISRKYNKDLKKLIDFSANINPLGMPEELKECINNHFCEIEKYPDISYYELKESIKKYENENLKHSIVSRENIVLGNGAAEVIYSVVRAVNPKKTIIMAPTFSEYEEAVLAVSGEVILHYLKEEENFILNESVLEKIDESIDMIFICTPNNPTGALMSEKLLKKVLDKGQKTDTFVVVDESFLDFIKDGVSMIQFINKYNNLIVIKSLTKFFALPGLRMGYGVCGNKELCIKIEKMVPAWNINIFADICAQECLKNKKYISETIDFVEKERNYLYNELKKVNYLKIYKPKVNFIFFRIEKDMDLKRKLLEKNILIRSCSNYHGLNERYFRIAVRTHEENERILNELNLILK